MTSTARSVPRWPLLVLCLPAFVAVWAGWVGLGKMTGFGKVNLLPGIGGGWTVDTAITLPIGVETYAAYALWVWLSGHGSAKARRFARTSAVASLLLGAAGQIAYHLLVPVQVGAAPWWITTIVACLPVLVLGMGSALAHMADEPAPDGPPERAPVEEVPAPVEEVPPARAVWPDRGGRATLPIVARTARAPRGAHPSPVREDDARAPLTVPTIVLPRTAHPTTAHPPSRTNGHRALPAARPAVNGSRTARTLRARAARAPRAGGVTSDDVVRATARAHQAAHPDTDLAGTVRAVRAAHPDASARALARALSCSDSTVRKYLEDQ